MSDTAEATVEVEALDRKWRIPAVPSFAFLAAVADLADSEEADDDTGKLRAAVAVVRALLDRKQLAVFGRAPAQDAVKAIIDAAHAAYGVVEGNS